MPGSACCAPPAWPGALSLTSAMRLAAARLTATLVTRPDPYQTSALDVADCVRAGPRQLHRGTPIDPDNFSHAFSRLCESAGLGHWHPHELRHSGASLKLAQGTPLHVVSEVLGHASIAITKDVYGHLVEGDKRAAAESMSGLLFGTG